MATMTIDELRERIRELDRLYRKGKSPVSDTEYDKLFDELKRREIESGEPIPADSPTQRLGKDTASNKEVEHKIPMLSIENVYNTGELNEFGKRVQKSIHTATQSPALVNTGISWVVELKIDGVSLALFYEKGRLVQGITRGNGIIGSDVTHNLDMIADVPKTIANKNRIEVRGEVYMLNSDLVKLNEEQQQRGEKIYKNTRNLTTGTISLKDPAEESDRKKRQEIQAEHQRRKLHFFAHSVGSEDGIRSKTHWDFLQELRTYGIEVAPHTQRFDSFEQAVEFCESLYDGSENFLSELDFEIDGLVLKVNDFSLRKQLGSTGHHPRWVIAYKVEKYEAVTTVKDITVQVGKMGTITPVAELEPVEIAGTVVSRASLHNAEEIERKDIRVGDAVVVEKAGKIIPHIVRVEKHLRQKELPVFSFPERCPVCGTVLSKDTDGVYIRCGNSSCPAQFKEKLKYFAGRNAMDIEGLGVQLIEQVVDRGLVKTFADLYRLKDKVDELLQIERLGKKSIDKLLTQIEKSKDRELRFLLNALSIRHVGGSTATALARHFGSLERLRNASETELSQMDGIGGVMAQSIVEYFRNEKESLGDLLNVLGNPLVSPEEEKNASDVPLPLSGLTIVVTGTLEHFKRNEIEDVIVRSGGRASSSVSSKTSFVLVGREPGSKFDKAKQLGIRIVSETEFEELIKGSES